MSNVPCFEKLTVKLSDLNNQYKIQSDLINNFSCPQGQDVEKFIKKHKHLEGFPSAAEVENSEVDLFEILKLQQKKLEEATLYLIELKKENNEIKAEYESLKKLINELKNSR